MSHNTIYKASFKDLTALKNCCETKGYEFKFTSTVNMYGSNTVRDAVASIHLPGWRYDIAVKANGDIVYDHFGSEYNTMEHLGFLKQSYNEEILMGEVWENCDNYYEEELSRDSDYYGVEVEEGDKAIIMEYD
jgi:hypothetical protein